MTEGKESVFLKLMKYFGKHFPPPHFDDEDKNQSAYFLNLILLHGIAAGILVAAATAAAGQYDKTVELAAGVVMAFLLLVLLHSGRLRSAIFLTFVSLLALVTILLYTGGGIHDLASMLYPVIIIIAALLLRPKEFLAIVALSMLSAAIIIMAEVEGLIAWPQQLHTTVFVLITVMAIFILAAVPARMLANNLRRSIERARRNEQESRDSNVRLQNEIAEHKRTEAALNESETRFRILAEATFEGMCILENNTVIDANSNLVQMLGGEIREIVGRKITEFMDPETTALVNRDQAAAGAPLEHEIRRLDGSQFPAEIRSKLIPFRG
ncbi:MAG: PAS domain S-box protein, partial [Candidatus Aminicenantes bacterium]|nr:PAS domain S-box protein [Candidatus Aminicenantes bacterium]